MLSNFILWYAWYLIPSITVAEQYRVQYGYFTEARPIHVACARGYFDFESETTQYTVSCYPQASGRYAASKLDNGELDIATLGSTPLAEALVRQIDLQVIYISGYKGDSQGIYVRPSTDNYTGVVNPSDLKGKRLGLPFGSTIHYQALYFLDLLDLTGNVELVNLSPSAIIEAWDKGEIDAAGCWGVAREHILGNSQKNLTASTLVTASVFENWGRPTFNVIAAKSNFIDNHETFLSHFVAVLASLTDSFIDQIGVEDPQNQERWNELSQFAENSYVRSMSHALMQVDQDPPKQEFINYNRLALNLFVQQTTEVQLSCDYLGSCDGSSSLQQVAIHQTAEFLVDQKILSSLGKYESINCDDTKTFCNKYNINGKILKKARDNFMDSNFLSYLESRSVESIASNEIGRTEGDSTCTANNLIYYDGSSKGSFGDGANVDLGKSYSDGIRCTWIIRGADCRYIDSECTDLVQLAITKMRVWSGDFIRIYSDPSMKCSHDSLNLTLLAQLSGLYPSLESGVNLPPPLIARGCMRVEFVTDQNQERSYGDVTNMGDGFYANYNLKYEGCSSSDDCNGSRCLQGLCLCDESQWGGDCSHTASCYGTKQIVLNSRFPVSKQIKSSAAEFYPNDLDCSFEISDSANIATHIELDIAYDLESTFDLLHLQMGSPSDEVTLYETLTGSSKDITETYYIPVDDMGFASIRFTTDSRGRRFGFSGNVRAVILHPTSSCEGGFAGAKCEIPHCIANNKVVSGTYPLVDASFQLGRILSQRIFDQVRSMPWAPEGGCKWNLANPTGIIRMIFNSPLDLEPYSTKNIGDKLIVKAEDGKSLTVFVEKCNFNGDCIMPWQVGICSSGSCLVKKAIEFKTTESTKLEAILVTDRSDGDEKYSGVDLDVISVQQCPSTIGREHCENDGGKCVDGYCICNERIPCNCPCEGDPALIQNDPFYFKLLLSLIIPLSVIFILVFWWYRRCKVRETRAQQKIIAEREAELEVFRNSVVGMRTAIKEYIPGVNMNQERRISLTSVMSSASSRKNSISKHSLRVHWCWRETAARISMHDINDIFGDPADCLVKYDEQANAKLEQAFQENRNEEYSPLPGYKVNFQIMKQKNLNTGYQRDVVRNVDGLDSVIRPVDNSARPLPSESPNSKQRDSDYQIGERPPDDLLSEPHIVLVEGDIIQISSQREDGWAFGTKLHHHDEEAARELVLFATIGMSDRDNNVFTDTGWFQLEVTQIPSEADLAVLHDKVGDVGTLNKPSHWDPIKDPSVVQTHTLEPGSDEYDGVLNDFMSTIKLDIKILKIERIQNLAMWQSYVVKRQTICSRETTAASEQAVAAYDNTINQRKTLERFERRWLWHGTNLDGMSKILQQGFNRSFCGKNATHYGKGVYFARDASVSARTMYAQPDKDNSQYIMACRVVVGEYCIGKRDALTPDVRNSKTHTLYDSTVGLYRDDTMANPSIYVTYHDAQAYPEYLIKFRRTSLKQLSFTNRKVLLGDQKNSVSSKGVLSPQAASFLSSFT